MAVQQAGLSLFGEDHLYAGHALSADLTGKGWRDYLGYPDAPVLTPYQAGVQLAELAGSYDFAIFEFWLSDITGHKQDMDSACKLLENFDLALNGILETWDDDKGLILITSDHGNLEDLSTRRHTLNPVPALLIGSQPARSAFTNNLADITDIAPAILRGLQTKFS
jgi:bisphosphoglycerate-independent phosphoglycerate mutase (AlkP superfamily)